MKTGFSWLRFLLLIVTCVGVALLAICIFPAGRNALQQWIGRSTGREILATADGDLLNNGKLMKVIKYQGPETIFLEVIDAAADKAPLVARIVLPDRHDGFFNLHGRVTRLAIADIDNDGQNELLAPTFDDQLVPHLNVYRYDPHSGRFEAVKPP